MQANPQGLNLSFNMEAALAPAEAIAGRESTHS
jgi:hypothetical protein